MSKYYFVSSYPKVYRKSADKILSKQLEKLGFEYQVPEIGGGTGEVVNHILTYLSLDTTKEAVLSGVLTNLFWEVIKKVYYWNKEYRRANSNPNPSVNIYIYTEDKTRNYFINIDANREYKESEIEKIIKSEILEVDSK